MKILKISFLALILFTGCKKQLDIKNTNEPSPNGAATEAGVISLSTGAIYRNGFFDLKYSDGVYGRFWAGATGFHEMMGDIIGVEAANAYINQIGCPNKVTLDNNSVLLNPSAVNTQYALLRSVNVNAQSGSNPSFYEWAYMYNMIVAANTVLDLSGKAAYSGADAASKKATVNAWAYWWKGYAYARIGSIYYAGIKQNATFSDQSTNGNYLSKEAIIAESNTNFDACDAALSSVTSTTAYTAVLGQIIPAFLQTGKGGVFTVANFKRNINTMKARNILVNTLASAMTTAQWTSILNLTMNGIQAGDIIFTGRTNPNGDFLGTTIADKVSSSATSTATYKLSERFVQEFKAGDKRFTNNIRTLNPGIGIFNQDRGNSFNTRYTLFDGGKGLAGVIVYSNTTSGANEITLCGTYEENELMKAEATMNIGGYSTSSITAAMALIDNVRNYQGAGLGTTSAASSAEAKEELRRERRVALAFKGLSFYDARRWDIIDPSKSRTGAVVLAGTAGVLNTNATINYGFLDYWDVPDNELAYNPAAAGSAPIK
ncbi:MAG: RagB/SusD family nutrient uptake outer membrane protein, partial [Pedobacter sp.]|nr:RagB/SusD family nutrient uptake outer membrane protein [Pedobacter sp.]